MINPNNIGKTPCGLFLPDQFNCNKTPCCMQENTPIAPCGLAGEQAYRCESTNGTNCCQLEPKEEAKTFPCGKSLSEGFNCDSPECEAYGCITSAAATDNPTKTPCGGCDADADCTNCEGAEMPNNS